MKYLLQTFLCLLLFFNSVYVIAQDEAPTTEEKTEEPKKKKSPFKPFEDVITEEAVSDSGLLTIHRVDEKWYFEIPDKVLNKDILLVSRIAKIPANLSPYLNAGSKTNEQVVHWERKGAKIILKGISYNNVAADSLPIYQSVKYNNLEPIIGTFKIEALNKDTTGYVIDVTSFFQDDIPSFSGLSRSYRTRYRVSRIDKNRTFIDTIRAYPINVEVRHTLTYNALNPPSNDNTETISLQMNQSMILLPEKLMQPRLHDERVGWFTVEQIDYGSEALKSDEKTFIQRWRLEPKDPAAYARGELVEPKKPIVYYLDPATPEKWRPYFRKGVEDWQAAFETAGFKNAIIAKDPPSPEEDPEFSPEDARYSTVRYVASTTRNAVGPRVADPRSGEILESDIIWYHNHLRSYRNRYLIETGAANPKARTLDTPEEEIGEMMRRVISHEIGHALGLPHNMKASSAYPVESLRSGAFTQEYGIATTIMDYARYNYVAQPGDKNIRFIRQLGPYDHYSINWGYRWIPGAGSPEAELPTLRKWIREKEGDPIYMFGSGSGGIDPNSQTENVGDDAVKASAYGMANLKRVVPKLIEWTTKPGEDYDDLSEIYGELLSVWSRYVGHVVANVGGVYETLKTSDQEGAVYEYVPGAKQKEALGWLLENAFATPEWLMDKEILQRIEHGGYLERIGSLQERHLNSVLDMGRLQRLLEAETFGEDAYPLLEMLGDLRMGIWSEAYRAQSADASRRSLQRAYLERLSYLMTQESSAVSSRSRSSRTAVDAGVSDIRPVVKAELKTLQRDLQAALPRASDVMMEIHLEDCLDRIAAILDPAGK